MRRDQSIESLLLWRSNEAELEAPVPPSAAELLGRSRPWWVRVPEDFQRYLERLSSAQQSFGYAQVDGASRRSAAAVPALFVHPDGESLASVTVTYLGVREGRIRLRFVVAPVVEEANADLTLTFIEVATGSPLLEADAEKAGEREYRLEADLPVGLVEGWSRLRVTDVMPFRLIVHAV